jgi:uncharacterized protein YdhG (YjbR/CyaY superfamily)
MGEVDEFLASLPADEAAAFGRVVELAYLAVPGAEQGTSYGLPAMMFRGRPLLGFARAKQHLSLFPSSPAVIEVLHGRLDGYSLSKGTIRFTASHQLPDDVITDLVILRRSEIEGQR